MSAELGTPSEPISVSERSIDHDRAERAVRELLEAIGEDPHSRGSSRHARSRRAREEALFAELFRGGGHGQ